ncbi:MAG: enoyl-CoA hydratase/isomerase family protein [Cyclobacteriaceae bacterium]
MTEGSVDISIQNSIGTITFSHPQSNSLPGDILQKLADTIKAAGENPEVKVLILKSAGDRTFCAGASFDELISIQDFDTGKKFFMGFAKVINACRTCPKLIIGRVQGKAVGGGIGIASAVDYCHATKFAAIRLSELAIGIGPFVVGPAVQRKVGLSAMSQMAMQPKKWYDANWAKAQGLYAEVHESAEELDEAVAKMAEELAGYNPEATAELKSIFWEGTENWNDLLESRAEKSGKLVLSEFTRNAIQAFKTK